MKIDAKKLYEKMVDYQRFAMVLLAVGVFFYLGIIIPNETKTAVSELAGMAGSVSFLLGAIYFFSKSKKLKRTLEEHEEGEEYLSKK